MPDTVQTFLHYREVPDSLWRWPNFSPAEIACRGTGQLKLHPEALDKLVLSCPRLPRYRGATARHAIYGGQWRRLDRNELGRDGPSCSLISRRLHQRA